MKNDMCPKLKPQRPGSRSSSSGNSPAPRWGIVFHRGAGKVPDPTNQQKLFCSICSSDAHRKADGAFISREDPSPYSVCQVLCSCAETHTGHRPPQSLCRKGGRCDLSGVPTLPIIGAAPTSQGLFQAAGTKGPTQRASRRGPRRVLEGKRECGKNKRTSLFGG